MSNDFEDLATAAFEAELYPAGPPAEGADEVSFGVCLSGGGSRALSCALGQLSGLRSLPDPLDPDKSMLDRADHLSSVSGGSWAAVVYTFLPETIDGQPVSDEQLLIAPSEPAALVKLNKHDANPANVAYMDPHCLGTAPQRFDFKVIAEFLLTLHRWKFFDNKEKWPWFWIAAVGELILKPFGLYAARYDRNKDFLEPARFFSLSADYVEATIMESNPSLDPAQFYTVRAGRPPLVVNTNLLMHSTMADPPQTPVQVTPIEGGVLGQSPDGSLIGGGSVESFAFTSSFQAPGSDGDAAVTLERRYSLCDIAGCSSAFFAEALLQYVNEAIDEIIAKLGEVLHLPKKLDDKIVAKLEADLKGLLDADLSELIPHYNYWPLAAAGVDDNAVHGFSDGGDFENTGILGMLARTDANRIVAFVNSEDPLRKDPDSGEVIVSGQLAQLFGYQADPVNGKYVSYGGMSAAQPMSFVQVFEDRFAELRQGLYQASCGGPAADADLGSFTVAFTQTLITVDNPVAHISGGRSVRVLWVYNNRVNQWQDAITDAGIRDDLATGQANQNRDGSPIDAKGHGQGPVANFPWYSTGAQIHIDKEGVNMLAQLSAWNVRQLEAQINALVSP